MHSDVENEDEIDNPKGKAQKTPAKAPKQNAAPRTKRETKEGKASASTRPKKAPASTKVSDAQKLPVPPEDTHGLGIIIEIDIHILTYWPSVS